MGSLPLSEPLRWPYAEFDEKIFQIHSRLRFSIVVVCSISIIATIIFFYTRWICRFSASNPPAPSDSAIRHFPPEPSPRRGLDLAEIENMPIVLYRNLSAGGGKFHEAECCICLGLFSAKEKVKVLPPCRHCIHSECLDKWLSTQSSCPLCRASLQVDSPV
ncbi:RING-H2 finger protein ATL66-like [Andrographis paniculata]|uniref:RING-H2 finger protein ATL66-like n=1 Tax=Andrographis paniculata TaxID=175694 RepID=UPI0021E79B61|nr:RING-H2 finger protein ATL66-like [Andrographis paniculata]